MATRVQNLCKTNLPPLEAWTENIATKMADPEFWNKNKKMESKTDQSKYTKNELVQPIRIKNSVNKHSDAI